MQKQKTTFIQLTLGLLFIVSIIWVVNNTINTDTAAASTLSAPVVQTEDTSTLHSSTAVAPNCRYGVSSWNTHDKKFLEDAGVGWVLDFRVNFTQSLPDNVEYTPIVRFKPELDESGNRTGDYRLITPPFTDEDGGLGPIIADHPGSLWLVGNEVERVDIQDDLMPNVYAKAYHDTYHFIKERDPSAQIAISGLVQVTPGRLQYLDIVWDSYLEMYGTTIPVDVWNMHVYILPEKHPPNGAPGESAIALGTDPAIAIWGSGLVADRCSRSDVYCYAEHDDIAIFADQVVAMRQWMKNHGQQNKPLILSEFSLLWPYDQEGDEDPNTCYLKDEYGNCFTPERVSTFMTKSFDYLENATDLSLGFPADSNRLVQQWLWFTVYDSQSFSSNLLEAASTATDYVTRLPGETFINYVNEQRPFASNSFISQVSYPTATTITPTGTISTTISATIYNNGNTATATDITVRFYEDEAANHLIGTGILSSGLIGCARNTDSVDVVWDGLSAGVHPYWAKIEGGNTVEGFVIINPEQVFLPIILR